MGEAFRSSSAMFVIFTFLTTSGPEIFGWSSEIFAIFRVRFGDIRKPFRDCWMSFIFNFDFIHSFWLAALCTSTLKYFKFVCYLISTSGFQLKPWRYSYFHRMVVLSTRVISLQLGVKWKLTTRKLLTLIRQYRPEVFC